MKIPPVETELFQAERRTDESKLIVAFLNFSNAPKIKKKVPYNATTEDCK